MSWRADYTSWYQVPVIYAWNTLVTAGSLDPAGAGITGRTAPAEGDTVG